DFGAIDPETGTPRLNEASNDRSTIDQKSWGGGLQITSLSRLAGRRNQLIAGVAADLGDTSFAQEAQNASFTADRDTVGSGDFLPETGVGAPSRILGAFFFDSFALDDAWTLTISGRYNRARVTIADRSGAS